MNILSVVVSKLTVGVTRGGVRDQRPAQGQGMEGLGADREWCVFE